MVVQADITFDRVPEYGVERPGAVVATFDVPPPPWEQQQQQQRQQQQGRWGAAASADRWERGTSSSSSSLQPQSPQQPLPPPPRLVGFFTKRIERGPRADSSASAASTSTSSAASPADKKHLSFNTPRAASALLPVRAPPLPSDLNEGYPDGWASTSYRASVSDVVLAARAAGVDPLIDGDIDVVTFRSNLRPILGCCIDPRKEWTVDAISLDSDEEEREGEKEPGKKKKKKTVFLEIVQHLEDEGGRVPFPDEDRFFYWGFKFESLCFGSPRDEPVRTGRTEFNAVMVRELLPPPAAAARTEGAATAAAGKWTGARSSSPSAVAAATPVAAAADCSPDASEPLKLLVVAEMDGFDEELAAAEAAAAGEKETPATTATAATTTAPPTLPPTPPLSSLVELKTLKWPEPGRDFTLFNLKAPTWWLQCFLG